MLIFYSIEHIFGSGLGNGLNASDSVGPYGTLLVYFSFDLDLYIAYVLISAVLDSRIILV
jgi:hypothetical protein